MATKFLDKTGLSHLWSKFKEWCNSIFVTKATDENITGTKTFVGSKKIAFKQSGATDKLGFTLFNNSGKEQGYLEYNPTNKIAGVPLMTLGNYATANNELTYVGFRRYSNISGASGAYNLLTPLISDAKSHFNLTTTYTNFYLPLGISDGTNIVTASNSGIFDISSLLSSISTIEWSDVISKPTTISGYGITDAKIDNGTITLGSNTITPLTSHQTLPTLSSTVSGSGNAITDIIVSDHTITAIKGSTFLTSHQDISGKVNKSGDTMTGDLKISTSTANQLRLIQGNYGIILRNDGGSFYLLQTASGEAEDGSWNSARPLTVNLSTGICNINGNAATVSGTAGTSLLAWNTENTVYTIGGHAVKVKLPANPNTDTHWTSHLYAGASNGNANAATTNGNTYLILCDNTTARDRRLIKGTGATTVTSDANGVITIHSTDNNTTYSAATQSANGLMSAADKKKLDGIAADADSIPVGTIIYYTNKTVPANFLICNGGAVSRTTYATLFGVIGTTFGTGNGSSTFNVPNLIDRFPQGNATPGTVKAAGLPNITGGFGDISANGALGSYFNINWWSGAFYQQADAHKGWRDAWTNDYNTNGFHNIEFSASRSSSIYGNSSTVQPPALTLVPCIRYA